MMPWQTLTPTLGLMMIAEVWLGPKMQWVWNPVFFAEISKESDAHLKKALYLKNESKQHNQFCEFSEGSDLHRQYDDGPSCGLIGAASSSHTASVSVGTKQDHQMLERQRKCLGRFAKKSSRRYRKRGEGIRRRAWEYYECKWDWKGQVLKPAIRRPACYPAEKLPIVILAIAQDKFFARRRKEQVCKPKPRWRRDTLFFKGDGRTGAGAQRPNQ